MAVGATRLFDTLRPGESSGQARVRVRTLVLTRWIAVAGQTITLLTVSELFHVALPMTWAMAAVASSALLNIVVSLRHRLNAWHSDRTAMVYLAYDILQLAALLYLTGGLQNPFALLILVPVTISATVLSLTSTVFLGLLAFACISLLARLHLPLPWPGGSLTLPAIYIAGAWVSLSLGMTFLMLYAWRVAEESRRMSDALGETQLALAREQQLSSLGGLAAAAAHELGTPLGTIALVAKELARELPPDSPHADDVRLLNIEAERCRSILARLARDPYGGHDDAFARMPVLALVEAVAAPHRSGPVQVLVEAIDSNTRDQPVVRRSAELLQGLGNLIENAADFARQQVRVDVGWDAQRVRIVIADDGPGFAPTIVDLLGEPYVSTRRDRGGMGLGVFISKTLLERTGASLSFANRRRGRGAVVAISWPRAMLEEPRGRDQGAVV